MATSCSIFDKERNTHKVVERLEALEKKEDLHKPSFATQMILMQSHYTNMRLALQRKNYPLLRYHTSKLQELFVLTNLLHPTFPTVKDPIWQYYITHLDTPLESLKEDADNKSLSSASENFSKVTNACNKCHQQANVAFIAIK